MLGALLLFGWNGYLLLVLCMGRRGRATLMRWHLLVVAVAALLMMAESEPMEFSPVQASRYVQWAGYR